MGKKMTVLLISTLVLLAGIGVATLASSLTGIKWMKPSSYYDANASEKAYREGYNAGKAQGYTYGYSLGRDEGYRVGREEGYKEGFMVRNETCAVETARAYEEGYREAFATSEEYARTSFITGNTTGYSLGLQIGKEQGYVEGFEFGNETGFKKGMNSVTIKAFQKLQSC